MPRPARPDYSVHLASLEEGPVNVDGFSVDPQEIWDLAVCLSRYATAAGRTMFPERPTGYRAATISLGHYAFNKATAMRCRASGDMTGAAMYERICHQIYGRLPAFARW